nr:hypothetical protein [Tanacetum cinerariifolium]
MTNSETESDDIVTSVNKEKDASNRELTKINAGVQDEGQAGSNPGKQDEGQAGLNPCNAAEFQPQPSHVAHAGPNIEPMDLVAAMQTKPSAPKATKDTKPAGDKTLKPTSSQPPKPKPTSTKPSKVVPDKKRKLVKETPDKPSPAKRSKGGLMMRKLSSNDEQVAHTLLDLNTLKKKSAADQYILQKRTPEIDEPIRPSSQPEDEGITMTNSETESDDIVTSVNKEKDASN